MCRSISFQDLVLRLPHSTCLYLTTQTASPGDAWEEEITGWDPRSTGDPSSSSFWPHQSDATSRLGPDLVPPSLPVRTDDEMSVQEHETTPGPFTHPSASETIPCDVPATSVQPQDSVQTMSMRRMSFQRPPNPLHRVQPPKRTGDDDDVHSALLSACHHDLKQMSENLNDGRSVFSGTEILDMSDSAWLAIKIKAETPKSETPTEAQSVEPLQKDVDNLLVTVSFSLDEETKQQICNNPDPETAFNVMVRRRRAEVQVSTLSTEQKRELVEAKDKEGRLVVQGFSDQRLGKIPMSSPNASRRSRQMFLTFAASLGFSSGRLGRATTTMMTISKLSQHNPFCEPVPELFRKLQVEHHVEGRVRSHQCSKKMVPPCCHRYSKHEL